MEIYLFYIFYVTLVLFLSKINNESIEDRLFLLEKKLRYGVNFLSKTRTPVIAHRYSLYMIVA